MYFLLKIGIFHCYVSLPEGNHLVLAESMSFGLPRFWRFSNVTKNTLDLIYLKKSVGQPEKKGDRLGLKARIFTLDYIGALIISIS